MIKQNKIGSIGQFLFFILVLILALSPTTPTGDHTQDLNFRLLNIERRLDQQQQRIDLIERSLQNQTLSRANDSNNSTAVVLELQRQQLSLAEQVASLERRMLNLQKAIDQAREKDQEKKEKPKEAAKPKPTPSKP